MAFTGKDAKYFVPDADECQIQPAGIDLRLDSVYRFKNNGILGINNRDLPNVEELIPSNEYFNLAKGEYKIRFFDIVSIPDNAIGLCLPRSSLLRMGATLNCALWDPGYKGRGEALLLVSNNYGIKIQRLARIAQMYFIELKSKPSFLYNGIYNNENI
ncbi:MAG: deoxyuridine 5'-triphosphate nucleotidohydrolase [Caldisphaera sp.]|jgi:dUTP pyrophosphatase|nr:MAG: deoxyuridine 5'-triphosphate nucleotidohydrolase [Caldisphaera sp.]PMP92072.1 MAG: deoxyuridine 5'-triphosphate nucleotidohydrolase [Caldisphaera sp.]